MANENTGTSEEQHLYAWILEKGMYLGLVLLFITFLLYVTGILTPVVPLERISDFWKRPVDQYLAAVNEQFLHWEHLPSGWSWFRLLGRGDYLNFLPVAVLGGVTIFCFLAVAPGMFRRKDTAMALIACAEALIIALAASGWLALGH